MKKTLAGINTATICFVKVYAGNEHDSLRIAQHTEVEIMKSRFVGAALRAAGIAAVPVAALSIAAATAGAQGYGQRELFDWHGNVDQEIRIEMQGGRAATMAMGPREMVGYDNARTISSVPSANGYVSVQMREGRGSADVVQQPSAQNGYTTIVRIRDPQGGRGQYDIAAFWQPANGNYGYGNSGAYGAYGQYGDNGQYGNYGGYGYPQQVIVQQPVYRRGTYQQPVYGNGGKTLPSGDRGTVYQGRDGYPANRGSDRYPAGNGQTGKTLPGEARSGQYGNQQGGYRQRGNQQAQNPQQGKTLPGQASTSQQNGRWQRDR